MDESSIGQRWAARNRKSNSKLLLSLCEILDMSSETKEKENRTIYIQIHIFDRIANEIEK